MDFKKLTAGDKSAKQINVVIEIPQGSGVKYELDKKSGAMVVDRFIYASSVYPFNYGFIPNTKSQDGDPMDVMVISSSPVQSGAVIKAKPIGLLSMEDEAGIDTKIIAVPLENVDPFFAHIDDIADVDAPTRKRIEFFFSQYKKLEEDKWSKVHGFRNKEEACKEIKKSMLK